MIVVNLKNYKSGAKLLDLLKQIEIYYGKAVVAVPIVILKDAVESTTLDIFAQHVDFKEAGKSTGFVLPEQIVEVGGKGAILNHSEHRVKMSDIKKTLKRCSEVGLNVIVCASNLKETKQIMAFEPYAIAFEDKKLISTGKSITEHRLNDLKKFVEMMKGSGIRALCGAGISSGKDVGHAISIGCDGVLVSSVVANTSNPEKFLKEVSELK
ncbi:MAG: triose-phosphate isomerase [Nanoarchaeota archaeon]